MTDKIIKKITLHIEKTGKSVRVEPESLAKLRKSFENKGYRVTYAIFESKTIESGTCKIVGSHSRTF